VIKHIHQERIFLVDLSASRWIQIQRLNSSSVKLVARVRNFLSNGYFGISVAMTCCLSFKTDHGICWARTPYWTGIACLKLSFSSRISGGTPTIDWTKKMSASTPQRTQPGINPNLAVCQKMPQLVALGEAGNFQNVFHPFF
jgi:hypothetical protein